MYGIPSVCFTHVAIEFGSEAGIKKLILLERSLLSDQSLCGNETVETFFSCSTHRLIQIVEYGGSNDSVSS